MSAMTVRQAVSVRQAVLDDLPALADLFDQYRVFQGQRSDAVAARAFLAERFNHGESVLFIAIDSGSPAGLAQLYPSFSSVSLSRVFVLNDLYVAESARRRGIASRLLTAVEAYAWAFGSARITLNVAKENTSAQAFYIAKGWKPDEHFLAYHRFPPHP
jgi:ribosomal protein S18 acetylase RimI-like enzyme